MSISLYFPEHETLHSFLLVYTLSGVFGSQVLLLFWKKHNYPSYLRITFFGLWLSPIFFFCFLFPAYERIQTKVFLFLWTFWSLMTFFVLKKVLLDKQLGKTTPRNVYIWLIMINRISDYIFLFGIIYLLSNYFSLFSFISSFFSNTTQNLEDEELLSSSNNDRSFKKEGIKIDLEELYSKEIDEQIEEEIKSFLSFGWMCVYCGLYFGILSRDCAEVCTDKLASAMGFTNSSGLPQQTAPNDSVCGLCLDYFKVSSAESIIQLPCDHRFHEFCIAGWIIVGKKDMCPYCSEKVNIRSLYTPIWASQSIAWTQILDILRYSVVWNPLILGIMSHSLHWMDSAHL